MAADLSRFPHEHASVVLATQDCSLQAVLAVAEHNTGCSPAMHCASFDCPRARPAGSFTEEEQAAMMTSLRSATRNTGFERWLGATLMPPPGAASSAQADAGAGACCCADEQAAAGAPEPLGAPAAGASRQHRALDDVAEYLGGVSGGGVAGAAVGSPAGGTAGVFRPGWEDIFRMNQTQLEVRGCSAAQADLQPEQHV